MNEVLDAFQAAWVGRRRGAFRDMCAPDLHWEDPFCDEPLYGPEALADHAARLWEAFPDAKVEPAGERLTDGRFIAAPVRVSGTHLGAIDGIPATGKYVVVHAVLYCELDPPGEQLWRVRAFFDSYDVAVQVGVMPKRGTLGARALMLVRGFGFKRGE